LRLRLPTRDYFIHSLPSDFFLARSLHTKTYRMRRKGVIEYNSREEMEDAIRKLDNTRVGDRGENLIRVYKVCSGGWVL
jgi:hypothetical protein